MNQRLPKTHQGGLTASSSEPYKTEQINEVFIDEGYTFAKILEGLDDDVVEVDPAAICQKIISRDLRYQDKSTPRYYQATDPHSSHFQQYVLLHKPTGSAAFDSIFHDFAEFFANGSAEDLVHTNAQDLAVAWERNHAGQSFFPEV